MRKLILVDLNVMSVIKKINIGRGNDRGEDIDRLKEIDKRGNIISPQLSIAEAMENNGKLQTDLPGQFSIKDGYVLEEIQAISTYFSNADPDDFLKIPSKRNIWFDSVKNGLEARRNQYIKFIAQSREIFSEKIRKELRKKKMEELSCLADDLKLPKTHPLFVLIIAALYGNDYARDVFKIDHKKKTHEQYARNTYGDISALLRVVLLKHIINNKRKTKLDIIYLTFDKGLNNIYKNTEFISSGIKKTAPHLKIKSMFNVNNSIFSKASVEDMKNMEEILHWKLNR